MPEKEIKKEEKKVGFELVKVPTQTGVFIRDNENETILDDKSALVEILNELREIKNILKS